MQWLTVKNKISQQIGWLVLLDLAIIVILLNFTVQKLSTYTCTCTTIWATALCCYGGATALYSDFYEFSSGSGEPKTRLSENILNQINFWATPHSNASSYRQTQVGSLFRRHKLEKKREYGTVFVTQSQPLSLYYLWQPWQVGHHFLQLPCRLACCTT